MTFHYVGKYDENPEHLANQRYIEGSVKFKEPPYRVFVFLGNLLSIAILFITIGLSFWRAGSDSFHFVGFVCACLSLIPHEFLHALCYKGDVYMYSLLKKGMLFIVGTESMSKPHFILMSMLPNIVFGFIPFIIFLIQPTLTLVGTLGSFAIAFGAGDYINVFNALTQVPKDGLIYLYRQDSYWYIP